MITITMIKNELVPMMWPLIAPLLSLAIDKSNGELTLEDLESKILYNEMAVATISRDGQVIACVTFEQREFESGKRILHVATAGGESAAEWIDEMDKLCEQLAKKYNCQEIYIIGRPGWVKTLKHLDYTLVHTVISRKVGG
jgi:hypothetical protein